jgi:ring-1,2-phenylacetyl-CoA epoxidase subunit PaaD
VVTEERVWEALAEIPDPEIPPISIVDLGVVRGVTVSNGTVHVEFTPTFLGCPALEVMRDQMAERIRDLGAEPDVEVILDDSWSTDRSPAGRKAAPVGFAPPAPREAAAAARPTAEQRSVPYCGSTETAREHLRPTRAVRSATATAAASPSSSSRRSEPLSAAADLRRLVNSYQVSQAIHVAAILSIADLLADGPRSSDDLAEATGTNPRALYRLLRALAAFGVFHEDDNRMFSLRAR